MSDDKQFPLLGTAGKRTIPWTVAERAYATGAWGYSQSLERLAERGGFHETELDAYYPGWRSEVDELATLRALLVEAATVFAYIREADKGEVVLDPAIYVVVMHKDVIDQALDLLQRIQQAIPRSSSEAR